MRADFRTQSAPTHVGSVSCGGRAGRIQGGNSRCQQLVRTVDTNGGCRSATVSTTVNTTVHTTASPTVSSNGPRNIEYDDQCQQAAQLGEPSSCRKATKNQINNTSRAKGGKTCSTPYSRVVPHPSTNDAHSCLTSEFGMGSGAFGWI